MWELDVRKAERRRIDAFELWCWSPRVPWTARRSNQSILKEISPGCSLEGLMLKLKLQNFGHLMWRVDSLEKTDAGRDWGQEEKGPTEDEMAGWHHALDGRESEWTPGAGDGQGGLVCCNSWGRKELDMTEQLNWTEWKCRCRKQTYGRGVRGKRGWDEWTEYYGNINTLCKIDSGNLLYDAGNTNLVLLDN